LTDLVALQLDYQYRDFYGEVLPHYAEQLKAIEAAGCYVPRWYHAPSNDNQVLTAARPHIRFVLEIPVGSFILGIKHNTATGFLCSITDIGLNHALFSDPVPDSYFLCGEDGLENPGGLTYWFNSPYPVVSPGRFIVEFWSQTTENTACELVLAVAEVVNRPKETGVTNGK
jgi:hypothetical protein